MAKYQSSRMLERRQRILQTAQILLAEDERDFTMRDLASRANVALGTLYNLFGSQEALLSEAIADVFDERVENLMNLPTEDQMVEAALFSWTEATVAEILRVPFLAKKMARIYFTSEPGDPVRKIMHERPSAFNREQLEKAAEDGILEDWVDPAQLASDITTARYASIARWSAGEISDGELADAQRYSVCTLLAGALKSPSREPVIAFLQDYKSRAEANADAARQSS